MSDVHDLPDDPALLKRLLADRDALIERVRQEAAEQMEALRQRLEAEKKAEIDAILRRFYGQRSERFDPRQLLLFGIQVDTMPLDEPGIAEEAGEPLVTRRVRNRHKHGRQQLPEHLPRVEVEHDLADAEKPCPCCGEARQRIGHVSGAWIGRRRAPQPGVPGRHDRRSVESGCTPGMTRDARPTMTVSRPHPRPDDAR
jgi:hypothetical protein